MSEELKLNETLQFQVKEISLTLSSGAKFDISSLFEEINLYENLFTPCMTASITIRDSNNLFSSLRLAGTEKVTISLDKGGDAAVDSFDYIKKFVIYKITNRLMVTPTSQIYTMHLINEDFIFSLQKKIDLIYEGSYSEFVEKILHDHLKVPDSTITDGGSGKGNFEMSKGATNRVHLLKQTPFDIIDFCTKRALNKDDMPDFVFYENKIGYNFISLSTLFSEQDPFFKIDIRPKRIGGAKESEFLSARDFKILTSFDVVENIKSGSYAGKFIGFDTITRNVRVITYEDSFSYNDKHANDNAESNLVDFKNRDEKSAFEMYDSRIVSYPFQFTREKLQYIVENSPDMTNYVDPTHEYIFKRKAIFQNLMQRRIRLVMPGNFAFLAGYLVQVDVPKFALVEGRSDSDVIDETISGNYIILGVRHILKYNKHETVLEVGTDSRKRIQR